MMFSSYFTFVILIQTFAIVFAQGLDGVPKKSNSKPSDFKMKLAKTEFSEALKSSKSAALEDYREYKNESVSELGITVPPEHQNDTVLEDEHTYYKSKFFSNPEEAKEYWVNLDNVQSNIHEMLSKSHRQATTVELSFDFPFYGNPLRNITIATGGFLYMGDYLHNWIAATQYIAPLMANFDTSISNESIIRYADNGTAFTVEWNNVFIQERINDGAFTFQVTLLMNGNIIFAYKDIPFPVSNISDSRHPVKIGISDAYILERTMFFLRRKTIYEYHRIDMLKREISNDTTLYLIALPTCMSYKDCDSCMSANKSLECSWCDAVKRCSDGIDRHRQNWVANGCSVRREMTCSAHSESKSTDKSSTTTPMKMTEVATQPPASKASTLNYLSSTIEPNDNQPFPGYQTHTRHSEIAPFVQNKDQKEIYSEHSITPGAIVTIVIFILAFLSVGIWVAYAYKFPQTTSGQFLIKYRPSQWSFKKEDSSSANNALHI